MKAAHWWMNRPRQVSLTSADIVMLRISCPFCGERDENEFVFGGQAHIARPEPAEQVSDREWAEYLFFRDNPKDYILNAGNTVMVAGSGSMWCVIP